MYFILNNPSLTTIQNVQSKRRYNRLKIFPRMCVDFGLSMHGLAVSEGARSKSNTKKSLQIHYNDVIMGAVASQITSFKTVYSKVYSGAYQLKHQSSVSLAFVRGIHRRPMNSLHKGPVTRKMFPFDDVIMCTFFHYDQNVFRHNE